uniref:Methyltransferase-like protein n=1 Tax=Trypanosoma congolense (strain IL3000) TaxID=1068625 RepID=G0UVH8_TRYCI|nr:conserved hypothetical protein [Trypanosoma congolense IL3000]
MVLPHDQEKKAIRTRGGGIFVDPDAVNLHGNDFSLGEKLAELSTEERNIVQDYFEIYERCFLRISREPFHASPVPSATGCHSWDSHYAVNKRHFPLKNYIILAFPLLKTICSEQNGKCKYVVECGCGTGSTLLPIMRQFEEGVHFIGFDVSSTAVSTLLEHPIAKHFVELHRLDAFTYDICGGGTSHLEEPVLTKRRTEHDRLKNTIIEKVPGCSSGINIAILVFVLSSLPSLESMVYALKEIRSTLCKDGVLLFRDYAFPDHNFFRFIKQKNKKYNDLSFCKGDGTLQMFFEINFTKKLFALAGFKEAEGHELQYHCNRIFNRKNGKKMDKIFINGSFCLA